ncbi:MAG: lactate permease LctP family transporter [Acidobacteria bacterium]|nr:lactate permease LctP family transporter [Acidobacteriota bacterium]
MMWQQNYTPVAGSLAISAVVAAMPVFVLLYLLGVKRKPAWVAALSGLSAAAFVALLAYGMPPLTLLSALGYGAAFGLFPIGWVVFCAILLYRITLETGKFEIVKDSVGSLTDDRRLQALLIAFAFGAFIEGAAGFGTPVAVAAAMLTGLGFSPFYAAAICLLANTAPVAFGSIGTPILTLNTVTGLPLRELSARVGQICAPISMIVPGYLLGVMGGWRALRGVFVGAAVCGVSFAATQFVVSNLVGPEMTDILSSLAAIGSLVFLFLVWKPGDSFDLEGHSTPHVQPRRHGTREILMAWAPYAILVAFVLLWGLFKAKLNTVSLPVPWPGLHQQVMQIPPVVAKPSAYAAVYRFEWLAASGTACLFASLISALLLRMSPRSFAKVFLATTKQLALSLVTMAAVLALAFLMNYCGATATLGLAFAATGALFPFFSSLLGWLGVFLTGSDTSSNALFGNLQVVTAGRLGLDPVLMAASNSSGGVMGKMISLQSIAVAAAATGMPSSDEAKLFRFTLRHSVVLASAIGLITVVYAYIWRT